jgi:hypothetical protein
MFAVLHAAFTPSAICAALSAAVILPMGYVSPSGLGPARGSLEKFNLFVLTMANANSLDAGRRLQLERRRGRLAVTTGSPSSFSGLPLLWSQPHALFVPGSCSMTRKHISSAASAQLLLSATAGDLLTTYIHVSADLPYPVTKALQNFTKKGLVQDRSVPRY